MQKLDTTELQQALLNAPGWALSESKLQREWTFKDFIEAMKFVNQVAEIAEDAGHHPDIDIRYNRVKLALITHDAEGITAADANMAIRLNRDLNIN